MRFMHFIEAAANRAAAPPVLATPNRPLPEVTSATPRGAPSPLEIVARLSLDRERRARRPA